MRASTLLFKGASKGKLETAECPSKVHEIPAARRRAAASMKIDAIGAREQRRRLRCTAVESEAAHLDRSHFSVPLGTALNSRMRLLGEIEACEWLEHPNFLMLAFDRYVRFLEFRRDHPRARLVAPLDVRCVWLSHLQRPLLYSTDVRERYGDDAAFCTPGILDDVHFKRGGADIEEAKQLWSSAFGEPWDFEEMVESLALRYEEYYMFCEASYEDLTAENPTTRRCQDWIQFGISTLQVLSDRGYIEDERQSFDGYDFRRLDGDSYCFSIGLANHLILLYNAWIVKIAHRLLATDSCALAFPPPFPLARGDGAGAVWHAHMCFPRQYTRDCKRTFGGLLIEVYNQGADAVGRCLEGRMKRFFDLPAPGYEAAQQQQQQLQVNPLESDELAQLPEPMQPPAEPIPPVQNDRLARVIPLPELVEPPARPIPPVQGDRPARVFPLPIVVPFGAADTDTEASDLDFDEEYDSDCDKWDFS